MRFRLELRPRPRWGTSQRSPRLPSWILGSPTSKKKNRKRDEGRGGGRGKKVGKRREKTKWGNERMEGGEASAN